MARPKAFDTDMAVDQAMQVFWTQGYKATSLTDLISAMGISKSSFYETFGSKHDLFLATVDRYAQTITSQIGSAANMDAPAKKIIRALFDRAVQRMVDQESRRGCYLNNCAVEVSVFDGDAAQRVSGGLEIMEDAFFELVKRGQREGTVGVRHDARAMARFLTASLNGILVIGKANQDEEALYDIVDVALAALE